jgi:hypothetical protein
MRTYLASELIIDPKVYPRREVDGDHVFNLMEALRARCTLPPLIVCKVSKRIVDGAHRLTAIQRFSGADTDIECIEKTYKNDAELFLDAIKYNASNGRNLTRDDRVRIAELGETLGIDDDRLAKSLSVSEAVLGGLKAAAAHGELTPSTSPTRDKMRLSLGTRSRQEGRPPQKQAATAALSRRTTKPELSGENDRRRRERYNQTLTGDPGDYRAEIERVKRAHEIIERLPWGDKDVAIPEDLLAAVIGIGATCLKLFPELGDE